MGVRSSSGAAAPEGCDVFRRAASSPDDRAPQRLRLGKRRGPCAGTCVWGRTTVVTATDMALRSFTRFAWPGRRKNLTPDDTKETCW